MDACETFSVAALRQDAAPSPPPSMPTLLAHLSILLPLRAHISYTFMGRCGRAGRAVGNGRGGFPGRQVVGPLPCHLSAAHHFLLPPYTPHLFPPTSPSPCARWAWCAARGAEDPPRAAALLQLAARCPSVWHINTFDGAARSVPARAGEGHRRAGAPPLGLHSICRACSHGAPSHTIITL